MPRGRVEALSPLLLPLGDSWSDLTGDLLNEVSFGHLFLLADKRGQVPPLLCMIPVGPT